jgi:hypothetical protein
MSGSRTETEGVPIALDWVVEPRDIGPKGTVIERAANAAERAALTEALQLLVCRAAAFSGRVRPRGKERFELTGTITVDADQACVISLEPVPARLAVETKVQFEPAVATAPTERASAAIDVDPLELDIVETLDAAGRVPLGRVVYEEIAAALDPFPRRPDAAFTWQDPAAPAEPTLSPFAKLAALKKPAS